MEAKKTFTAEELRYLSMLARQYPTVQAASTEIINLQAILNLPNRKMMGQDSCGMLLSAVKEENGEEKLHLLMLDDAIPAGYRLC